MIVFYFRHTQVGRNKMPQTPRARLFRKARAHDALHHLASVRNVRERIPAHGEHLHDERGNHPSDRLAGECQRQRQSERAEIQQGGENAVHDKHGFQLGERPIEEKCAAEGQEGIND
jgi:hypothetical protein